MWENVTIPYSIDSEEYFDDTIDGSKLYLLFHEGLATTKNVKGSGQRNLAIAVLQDAFVRLLHLERGSRKQKKLAKEAKDWFLSKNDTGSYSFQNLCYLLDVPPSIFLLHVTERINGREKSFYRRKMEQNGDPLFRLQ